MKTIGRHSKTIDANCIAFCIWCNIQPTDSPGYREDLSYSYIQPSRTRKSLQGPYADSNRQIEGRKCRKAIYNSWRVQDTGRSESHQPKGTRNTDNWADSIINFSATRKGADVRCRCTIRKETEATPERGQSVVLY